MRSFFIALLLLAAVQSGWAREAAPAAADPKLEQRVNAVAEELRCLVCQNQTLADSHADLAIDLKNQIREKLKQGESEREITRFMVDRYGDFVLYRPPLKATTLILWIGPFLFLLAGLAVLFYRVSRRRSEAPLSDADHARAAALLATPVQTERR